MLGYCGAWGVGGWLLMLGLLGGFIALVMWAVSRLFPAEPRPGADELLDRRLAAGEARDELVPEQTSREQPTREQLTHEQMTGPARPKKGAR